MVFCDGEKRFRGFFRDEGQIELFPGEGPLVGATEQQQCSVRAIARVLTV